jgi:hypothetical protein
MRTDRGPSHGNIPAACVDVGMPPAKPEPLQDNDTFDVFFQWTIWTLVATGAALLLMAALI